MGADRVSIFCRTETCYRDQSKPNVLPPAKVTEPTHDCHTQDHSFAVLRIIQCGGRLVANGIHAMAISVTVRAIPNHLRSQRSRF